MQQNTRTENRLIRPINRHCALPQQQNDLVSKLTISNSIHICLDNLVSNNNNPSISSHNYNNPKHLFFMRRFFLSVEFDSEIHLSIHIERLYIYEIAS